MRGSNLLELMAAGEPDLPTDDYTLASGETALGGEVIVEHQTRGIRVVQEGDVLAASTQGSGGYGDVLERDPQAVVEDVRADRISDWTAREVFAVAYDPETLIVDEAATAELRRAHRARRSAARPAVRRVHRRVGAAAPARAGAQVLRRVALGRAEPRRGADLSGRDRFLVGAGRPRVWPSLRSCGKRCRRSSTRNARTGGGTRPSGSG